MGYHDIQKEKRPHFFFPFPLLCNSIAPLYIYYTYATPVTIASVILDPHHLVPIYLSLPYLFGFPSFTQH
jgi:hypothetical protein